MAEKSSIEWTDSTWNPITGCSKVSPGCKNCYAERMALRLRKMGSQRYRNGFEVTLHEDVLGLPLRWKKPRTIFVNSMSDLFHERVPTDFMVRLFAVMERARWHTFQILTKRSDRLASLAPLLPWPSNVWMGVSVETQKYTSRIDHLRNVPASVRFLSIEPLLGEIIQLQLDGIDWVIVGGESGPNCRPMNADWVRAIRKMCFDQQVPFFFKQWGGKRKKTNGRTLDGRIWDEIPTPKNRSALHTAQQSSQLYASV